ncbi:MAG TPA: 5,10-methylene-tetrahydrofolate dehydrogenase [Pseudogracilibacillus sp.]|nr:5,10-methylene-tetrahydrofolate dehydrogenase [Pseudogracilibacillus sp.]
MTTTYTVGLIAAPEFAERMAQKLVKKLPENLANYTSNLINWKVEMTVDPMTGGAETVDKIFTKAATCKEDNNWDYVICLTDLPIFHERNVVVADVNEDKGVILLSIPAFGWTSLMKKVKHAIIYTFKEIDNYKFTTGEPDESKIIWRNFSITPIRRIKVKLNASGDMHIRYLVYPKTNGKIRLLLGMAYANNPFKMMSNLTGVIAVAFTTGGFAIIFPTMWKLSHLFSNGRLITITILAILGMSFWVILAHELWEPIKTSSNKRISGLYNSATILTLLFAVSAYYIAVYVLFLGTSLILIPSGFLGKTLEMSTSASLIIYLKIAWFAASLSTMTGAIGVGLENENTVRDSTYGYRQRSRYKEMLENEKERDA